MRDTLMVGESESDERDTGGGGRGAVEGSQREMRETLVVEESGRCERYTGGGGR